MRYLVLSLILLNLGWLGWYFWIHEPPASNVAEGQGEAPQLKLAREAEPEKLPELEATEDNQVASVDLDTGAVTVPPEPEPESAPEPGGEVPPAEAAVGSIGGGMEEGLVAEFEAESEPELVAEGPAVEEPVENEAAMEPELVAAAEVVEEAPPVPGRCVTLGPFSKQDDAQGAVAKLSDAGYPATRRELNSSVKSGTWVYLSGYATRAEASEVVSSLKQQGVRDLMLMPAADTPHISLGFFSNPKLAEERQREIRRLGHQAQLRDRFRETTAHWLDFEIPADSDFDVSDYGRNLELDECP